MRPVWNGLGCFQTERFLNVQGRASFEPLFVAFFSLFHNTSTRIEKENIHV